MGFQLKLGGSLWEQQTRGPAREEGPRPGYNVQIDPFGAKYAPEGGRVDIVEAPFDLQADCGNFPLIHLEASDLVGQGITRVSH